MCNGRELFLVNIPNDELSIWNQCQRRNTLHPVNNQDIEGRRISRETYLLKFDIFYLSSCS